MSKGVIWDHVTHFWNFGIPLYLESPSITNIAIPNAAIPDVVRTKLSVKMTGFSTNKYTNPYKPHWDA